LVFHQSRFNFDKSTIYYLIFNSEVLQNYNIDRCFFLSSQMPFNDVKFQSDRKSTLSENSIENGAVNQSSLKSQTL